MAGIFYVWKAMIKWEKNDLKCSKLGLLTNEDEN